ncbi:hypothetical protein, partial [Mesorhizobium sp.]|uniref:hypothetical protein n=1 Tax=Mesorhizobium sp. TaxID=1871066 RepID=UPI0025D7DD34
GFRRDQRHAGKHRLAPLAPTINDRAPRREKPTICSNRIASAACHGASVAKPFRVTPNETQSDFRGRPAIRK